MEFKTKKITLLINVQCIAFLNHLVCVSKITSDTISIHYKFYFLCQIHVCYQAIVISKKTLTYRQNFIISTARIKKIDILMILIKDPETTIQTRLLIRFNIEKSPTYY